MCGRFVMGLTLEEFRKEFAEYLVSKELPKPSWNIAPTQTAVILVEDHKAPGTLRAEPARWSLTPPWSPTLDLKYPTFNARTEGITEKKTWSGPLVSRRCAIVTTGFYEWSGSRGARTPHFITGEGRTLLMAGLYAWWRAPEHRGLPDSAEAPWHLTATMLTQASTGIMRPIHDRMPVMLRDDLVRDWLDPATRGTQDLVDVVTSASSDLADSLSKYRVKPLRGDGPELLTPLAEEAH